MACAVFCTRMLKETGESAEITLLEQNEKLGKKLYITGKGRCNFTNACPEDAFLSQLVHGERFLRSAFSSFNNHDAIRFFEELGLATKIERGMRAFPKSDHASDVIHALEKAMRDAGIKICLNTRVKSIGAKGEEDGAPSFSVLLEDGSLIEADKLVIATGGLSYPSTGATGDGLRFAESLGLACTKCRPSLVPLITREPYVRRLQGLSLKNVRLTIPYGKKKSFSEFGEMLFTDQGISGPLALSASAYIGEALESEGVTGLSCTIDLKAALTKEQLDARMLREFSAAKNKALKNVMASLLPAKLRPVFAEVAGVNADLPVNAVTKEERVRLVETMKAFPLTIISGGGYKEAVITQGGVELREITPKSMESKRIAGLYLIGEVLDLDALTGGFNLQIAWTSAHACARAICEELKI